MTPDDFHIYALAENTLTVQVQPIISKRQVRWLHHLRSLILTEKVAAIRQVLVTFHELSVFYDSAVSSFDSMQELVRDILNTMDHTGFQDKITVKQYTIPVCYDEKMALDRTRLESHTGLSFAEITRMHNESVYTFYMMGFLPGFLYLGGLDDRLACPRLEEPRQQVIKGSVGIAGQQTGIYPMDSPGGWNIIGRTPLELFDFKVSGYNEDDTTIIQPLDEIKFTPISTEEYKQHSGLTIMEYQKTLKNK